MTIKKNSALLRVLCVYSFSNMAKNTEQKDRLSKLVSPSRRRQANAAYTRFVRVMRLALPLAAIGIAGLVMSWPRLEETMEKVPQQSAIPQTAAKNELIEPRFESADDKDQPFSMTAKRALQSARDPDVVLLDGPKADITLKDGTWIAAESDKGAYRQKAESLLLEGNVRLFYDEGYEVKTEKLLVNMKENKAWSDLPIIGQGPAGTIEATGVQAEGTTGKLVFTGPAKLVLNQALKGL